VDWSIMLHLIINLAFPFALFGLIQADLVLIAILAVVLSKWRVFTVRINHLPANLRANLTDLIVQFSTLTFMIAAADNSWIQIALTAWYSLWLIVIKPRSGIVWVSIQAIIAQILGTTALMAYSLDLHELLMLGGIWMVLYASAFHFLSSFEEPRSRLYGKLWALMGVELAWVLQHWNLKYFNITSQFTLVALAASYVAARIYITRQDGANKAWQETKVIVLILALLFILMIVRANWQGQID